MHQLLGVRKAQLLIFIQSLTVDEASFVLTALTRLHNKRSSKHISNLANEVLVHIFSFLHEAGVLSTCARVCRRWRTVLTDNILWKQICKKKRYNPIELMGIPPVRLSKIQNSVSLAPWKQIYMKNYMTWKNWTIGKYSLRKLTKTSHTGLCMEFNEKRAFTVSRGQGGRLWDISTGRLQTFVDQGNITAVKFDDSYIVSGYHDGSIRVWDIAANYWKHEIVGQHTQEIGTISLYKTKMATGSEDQTVKVWDLESGLLDQTLVGHIGAICSVSIKKSHILSTSTDYTIKIWSRRTGECVRTLRGHNGPVFCAQFTSKYIVSGGNDNFAIIWDFESGKKMKVLKGHHQAVVSLQFDDSKIVTGSADKTIKVWDLKSGYCLYTLMHHTSSIWNLRLNPSQIISSSFDQTLLVWDFSQQDIESKLLN